MTESWAVQHIHTENVAVDIGIPRLQSLQVNCDPDDQPSRPRSRSLWPKSRSPRRAVLLPCPKKTSVSPRDVPMTRFD